MTLVPVPVQVPCWVEEALERMIAPIAEEAGLIGRDLLRHYRVKLQFRFWEGFKKSCDDAKIQIGHVNLPLLFDILQRGTVEEDEELQDMWANLLANAADSRAQVLIRRTFPEILRNISKEEAFYLNEMFDINDTANGYAGRAFLPVDNDEMEVILPPKPLDDVSYDNLKRLGLIVDNDETVPVVPLEAGVNQFRFLTAERHTISSLGMALILACRAPKAD